MMWPDGLSFEASTFAPLILTDFMVFMAPKRATMGGKVTEGPRIEGQEETEAEFKFPRKAACPANAMGVAPRASRSHQPGWGANAPIAWLGRAAQHIRAGFDRSLRQGYAGS